MLRRSLPVCWRTKRSLCDASDLPIVERYSDLVTEAFSSAERIPECWKCDKSVVGQDFLVVHPKVRWGASSASVLKDPQRQLSEAVALVNTLPGFRVVQSAVLGVKYNTKCKTVWGSGQIEALMRMKQQSRVTALMHELFDIFRVPIYDRYNIVLSIFKHYAYTLEAHLQIQLAEIPYVRVDEFEVLRLREQSLRKKLKHLVEKNVERTSEETQGAAMVAVVGYTNAGKTSLVKCLTGAVSLLPEDRLFATLDTTRHTASIIVSEYDLLCKMLRLPSGRKVVFADTIGFLSDLPMHLLAAFHATLSHVKLADVIIHVRDMSNPDWPAHSEDVYKTLEAIGLPHDRMNDIIVADNKVRTKVCISKITDKAVKYSLSSLNIEAILVFFRFWVDVCGTPITSNSDAIRISCKTSEGVRKLIQRIDRVVLHVTGCKRRRLQLKFSSPAVAYLYKCVKFYLISL
uniref:Hflx-type G domain-containing protein n=1 Tax=Angiostrongylus cantonensis TaxID=6313 RepID=A0A0K0DB43_ANGCA